MVYSKGISERNLLGRPSYLLTAVVELPLGRVLDSVSLRLPGIAYHFKHFSGESRIGASNNPSNLFFIEGIWLASDSRGIDCVCRAFGSVHIYTSFSHESIILITSCAIKDCSQKYDRGI